MITEQYDVSFETALSAHSNGQYKDAESLYTFLLTQNNDLRCWQNLGVLYRQTGRQRLAVMCYRQALALHSDAGTMSNLANALKDLERLDEALEYAKKAVDLEPDNVLLRHNYAISLREAKCFEESLRQLELCLEKKPGDAGLEWDRAYVLLYLQDYQRAWPAFESRWRTGDLPAPDVPEGCRRWQGESFQGQTLLLLTEQGFGDTLFAARYVRLVAELGGEVLLECKPPLKRLFADLPVTLVSTEDDRAGIDYYCPLMSLPGIFQSQQPEPVTLSVPEAAGKNALAVLPPDSNRLKVGIIWSGSVTYGDNNKRSVALEQFIPLLEQHPEIEFYSLQKGPRETDLNHSELKLFLPDLGSRVDDFADTAAVLQQLDLLVMTDSATAHLAGSLGVPVLNLLQYKPYWLYYPEAHTSHWYPSMRFIQQVNPGDWQPVFELAADILGSLKANKASPSADPVLTVIDRHF